MIMMTPLAQTRRRRHFVYMTLNLRLLRISLLASTLMMAGSAWAQSPESELSPPDILEAPEAPKLPDTPKPKPKTPDTSPDDQGDPASPDIDLPSGEAKPETKAKDLTIRSEADRTEKLNELFANLLEQTVEEDAALVAEEIWAVFLQSRSATVDFMLLRGIAAHKNGDLKLARRMFNHVTRLQPEYAEGWSRSGRLAVDEKDLNRAANDTARSLVLEPRHFYALWTLGNILETLGRRDAAFEAYSEAAKLYPLHKEIKARVEFLRSDVEGETL